MGFSGGEDIFPEFFAILCKILPCCAIVYIAGRSIVEDIQEYWHISKAELPEATWEEAGGNAEILEQFRRAMRAWQEWAAENPRYSARFFAGDRQHRQKEKPR